VYAVRHAEKCGSALEVIGEPTESPQLGVLKWVTVAGEARSKGPSSREDDRTAVAAKVRPAGSLVMRCTATTNRN
jgi:hypothetical protein